MKNKRIPDLKSETAVFLLENGDYDIQTTFYRLKDIFIPQKYIIHLEGTILAEVIFQLAKDHSKEKDNLS